jgi:opacity protein-like surface antigen
VTDKNSSKDEDVVMGWTAGGGVEWAFTKIASMALEYRHNWYGDDTYSFDAHHGPIYPGSTRVNLDSDQVTFRVNLLLGRNLGP